MPSLKVRLTDELEQILNDKCKNTGMNKSEYIRHIILKSNTVNKVNQSHTLSIMQDVNSCLRVLNNIDSELQNIEKTDNIKIEIMLLSKLLGELLHVG